MLHIGEANEEESIEFSWGYKIKTRGPNKDVQLYGSFSYDGVKYFLYDIVYLWSDDEPEPHIGKLVKIWKTASHKKIVKVVWFFRPIEIQNWLGDVKPLEKEIFLASGEGKGLANLISLEAICGKCNVACISKDERNPQASEEELRMADFIFYRTFNVGSCRISDNFPDIIAGTGVEHFFNGKKVGKFSTHPELETRSNKETRKSSLVSMFGEVKATRNAVENKSKIKAASLGKQRYFSDQRKAQRPELSIDNDGVREAFNISCSRGVDRTKVKFSEDLLATSVSDIRPPKKRKLQDFSVCCEEYPAMLPDPLPKSHGSRSKFLVTEDSSSESREHSKRNYPDKARYISDKAAAEPERNKVVKTNNQVVQDTRNPDVDTRKWFKQQPWEERMQSAYEKGTLVLLENLDPSCSSSEVQDLVWDAFKVKVDAKMLQVSTFSSPHYGQAFLILKSKEEAEFVISELNNKCLMLEDGRPVIGRRETPRKLDKQTRFFGHLSIDKVRFLRQSEEMRKVVSTSHYSQPNTIEYEMAIEWRALQEKSNQWWKALHEEQAKEIEGIKSQLKFIH